MSVMLRLYLWVRKCTRDVSDAATVLMGSKQSTLCVQKNAPQTKLNGCV